MIPIEETILRVHKAINIKPTWEIVEYANILLTFSCLKAKMLPSVIVAAERIANKNVQLTFNIELIPLKLPASVNTVKKILINKANPAAFGATDKNAVIVVGDPS